MKKIIAIVAGVVILLGIGYCVGIGYYAQKFQANTKFGSIDISQLTLAEAQEKIEKDIDTKTITLTENGKEIGKISLADVGATVDTSEVLQQTYNAQDPRFWLFSYFKTTTYDNVLLNHVELDQVKLSQTLATMGLENANRIASKDAAIEYVNGKGYFVQPEEMGNQLDMEAVQKNIVTGLQTGSTSIEVNTAYLAPAVKSDDEKITKVMAEIDRVANTQLTLTISGNDVKIPKEKIMEWIYFDDNNNVVINQEPVQEYLKTLNEQYATYNKTRQFQSTLQGTVTVDPGTLGWSIDREAEAAQIAADLKQGGDIKREPTVVGTGYNSNGNDIGNTYVEVDIANQTMFIYVDGQQVLSTPVVTGRPGTTTVPGAYAVWNKETPSELKGFNPHTNKEYTQPVDFWIPFDDTGQGIHDANWQASFGGEAYLSSGSLGCINTPPGTMAEVFEIVQLGMPVIVF